MWDPDRGIDSSLWDDDRRAQDEIAQEDHYNRERNLRLRDVADRLAANMAAIPEVERVVLFGSVARPATTTYAHGRRLRRFGECVTRQCDDLDLAVWVNDGGCLRRLQRIRNCTVGDYLRATGYGIAQHMVDVFLMDAATGRHLGRLCLYNLCPRPDKAECFVPLCGQPRHLRQCPEFTMDPDALSPQDSVVLFDRLVAPH